MGNINLLLCDDDLLYAKELKNIIIELYPDVFNVQTATDQSFKIDNQYDVYFLDIDMPSISGFDLAEKIHTRYPDALIVFLTTHEELSMEGYQYQAFRFLSKQRLESMLSQALKGLKEYFEQFDQIIYAKDENDVSVPLLIRDITCVLAKGNYTDFNTEKDVFSKRIKVKEFLDVYKTEAFVPIERGVWVNMRHVKKYDPKTGVLFIQEGVHLVVTRKYKEGFLKKYIKRGTFCS